MYDVTDILPLLEQIVAAKPDGYTYTQKLNPPRRSN